MKEAGIERDFRDAVAGRIYSGTSEIRRVILSRMLGLRACVDGGERPGGYMAYLLQHLLTDSAARWPGRAAVAGGGRSLASCELDRLSDQVARVLLARGAAPGDRVGVLAPKSAASVVGISGALKAGTRYVPVDQGARAARLSAIMRDSAAIRTSPAQWGYWTWWPTATVTPTMLDEFRDDSIVWHALPRDVAAWWRRHAASSLRRYGDGWVIESPAAAGGRVGLATAGTRAPTSAR